MVNYTREEFYGHYKEVGHRVDSRMYKGKLTKFDVYEYKIYATDNDLKPYIEDWFIMRDQLKKHFKTVGYGIHRYNTTKFVIYPVEFRDNKVNFDFDAEFERRTKHNIIHGLLMHYKKTNKRYHYIENTEKAKQELFRKEALLANLDLFHFSSDVAKLAISYL